MKLKKGYRFRNYIGKLCIITYIRGNLLKLTYIETPSYTEVWDREEFIEQVNKKRFFYQPQAPINRTNISEHLVEYQLNMIGKTTADALKNENWYAEWTMTDKQHELFKSYAIPLLKKVFKYNKAKAEETFNWFDLQYGLRIEEHHY